jgi:hypothetical protein
LAGASAATLLLVAGLRRTLDINHAMQFAFDRGSYVMIVCALVDLLGMSTLTSVEALFGLVVAMLLVPVACTVWWLSSRDHVLSDRPSSD